MSRLTLKRVQGRHDLRNFLARAFAFLRSCYAVFRFVRCVQVMCACDRIADTNRANFVGMRSVKKDVFQVTNGRARVARNVSRLGVIRSRDVTDYDLWLAITVGEST